MDDTRKQKLIDLGPEILADALLRLSSRVDFVEEMIERLIATPEENLKRFKRKMSGLKRSRRFIDYRGVRNLSRELEMLLNDIQVCVSDPATGLELVASFYETDNSTLERCDDSNGFVGDVYRIDARDLFIEYASRFNNKAQIAKLVLKLISGDEYGARTGLIHHAAEYLPEASIRSMISTLRNMADNEDNEYSRRHDLDLTGSLARQIKDAKLFEQTKIASWDEPPAVALVDIARVYLESGDVDTAYAWLQKIPPGHTSRDYERDQLLLEIYSQRGDTGKLTNLLYKLFRSHRSADTFQALLNVTGDAKRDEIIADEIALIMKQDIFRTTDANFLILVGMFDEAENYLLSRVDKLDGANYVILLPLAKSMESVNLNLGASMLYRSLLTSILEQGRTKAYTHGVRHLKKLDNLAETITDWRNFDDHVAYKSRLKLAHGLKYAFWNKYEVQK